MIELNKDWKFVPVLPKISAYTTTYNCVLGGYPIERSLNSFLCFDEVIVVDGGSTDGTRELLSSLAEKHPNLTIYDMPINLEDPGKDGSQKAIARACCSHSFLVQFDIDEIRGGSPESWYRQAKEMPDSVNVLSLLVLEPIGEMNNLRMNKEHNPLKWRISRNLPEITHMIPADDKIVEDGKTYSKGYSDGCFYAHVVSGQVYPLLAPKKTQAVATMKASWKPGVDDELYRTAVREAMTLPYVLHLGHVDLESKIMHYLKSWHYWWCDLYNKDPKDPKNNLYFPSQAVSDLVALPEQELRTLVAERARKIYESTPKVDFNFNE